jgi:hypothetical protein
MNDSGGNYLEGMADMVSESATNPSAELRKRRSTRIVQAVPLVVSGVDALGRPFTERTSTLIINCHGCRYQSKHYVLKNMWVTLEIPHAEAGQPPRTVRGRVAWIQRPRTVRQLFQVALELEVPGNAWSIAFPPEDWFAFTEGAQAVPAMAPAAQISSTAPPHPEAEIDLPLHEGEPPVLPADNLRTMPTPASATDASLQLARQVSRLLADAKQQIQAAAREAASQAVSAERRLSFEQWEQKFAAARSEIANETTSAISRIQQETEERAKQANAAAAEALRDELPRWLAPQLEQLTRELTAQISTEAATQRNGHAEQLAVSIEHLRDVCKKAEESAGSLKAQAEQAAATLTTQAEQAGASIAARAEQAGASLVAQTESSARAIEEAVQKQREAEGAQRQSLQAAAGQMQEEVSRALDTAKTWWQGHLVAELDAAQSRWQQTLESGLSAAAERSTSILTETAATAKSQLSEETDRQLAILRDHSAEAEQRLVELRAAMHDQAHRLDSVLTRAQEAITQLEHFSARVESAQRQALDQFQAQLDDVLSLHRNELHRRSESLLGEIDSRVHASFEEGARVALEQFGTHVEAAVQPHITKTEEAIHRLAGGRSLLDAALTMQQERIRATADEAFAESLARFRENLGGAEQLLNEASQSLTTRNIAELEARINDLKHQALEDVFKSAEWYEKKAQTQIQNVTEKQLEHATNTLRDRAGEISGVFAAELDHSSRSFVEHTQTQMNDVVREAFDRARALFAEAAETTSAAFTDEIQRNARQELDGFAQETQRVAAEAHNAFSTAQSEVTQQANAEQENFLRRFHAAMNSAIESGVAEAQQRVQASFGPLLDSWKSMTESHQTGMGEFFAQMAEQAAEQHRHRLEGVSNQWMLATVASLDHQSRDVVAKVAAEAEERLRDTCTQVFTEMGDVLRQRLQQLASGLDVPGALKAKAQSSST